MSIRTARDVAVDVLIAVDTKDAYSNLALQSALNKAHLSSQDVALATEIVYGTIQWMRTIDYRLQPLSKQRLVKLDPLVRNLLRTAIYQIDYLDRVPAFAVVNESVEIAKQRLPKASGFVNAVLRNALRSQKPEWSSLEDASVEKIGLATSHPDWMVQRWVTQYGKEDAIAICQANNSRPHLSLRTNRLKTDRQGLLKRLQDDGIDAIPSNVSPHGVRLTSGLDIARMVAFQDGWCTVQDESSMLVADCLDLKPGMRVLDACAAPGGKTTHLAECMEDQGEIVAADIHQHKVELIRNATNRLGLHSIEPVAGDIRQLLPSLGTFDAILLDAPCTGLGVIRRKPDLKWKKNLEDIRNIVKIQLQLLHQLLDALRSGGVLVYSTCSIDREENEEVIQNILQLRNDIVTEDVAPFLPTGLIQKIAPTQSWIKILPHQTDSDGFFIARLRKM